MTCKRASPGEAAPTSHIVNAPLLRPPRCWLWRRDHITLPPGCRRNSAIPHDTPRLLIFVLEAQPLPDAPEFNEFGGAVVLCYQMPGLAADPVQHASEFLRGVGWKVTGIREEPRGIRRDEAPEPGHFDQALIDDEAYVFHQWRVDDADDQTRH